MQFTIKAAPLGAALTNVLPHAGVDDTLPVLKAVRVTIDSDGDITVDATDRYTLGEQRIPHNAKVLADSYTPGSVLIPLAFAKEIAKQAKVAKLGFLNIHTLGSRITVEYPGGSLSGEAQEGEFPKTARLWPEDDARKDAGRIGLGTANAVKFAKVVHDDLRPIRNATLELTFTGDNKPMTAKVSGLDNFRAIVMPVRLSEVA